MTCYLCEQEIVGEKKYVYPIPLKYWKGEGTWNQTGAYFDLHCFDEVDAERWRWMAEKEMA